MELLWLPIERVWTLAGRWENGRERSLIWFLGVLFFLNMNPVFFFLLSQDCFGSFGSFLFSYKFWSYLLYSCDKCHWCFDRDCTKYVDCLSSIVILTNNDSSNLWAQNIFPYVLSSSISHSFQSTDLFLLWSGLFLANLFFLIQL